MFRLAAGCPLAVTIQITGRAERELRRLDRQIELRVRGVIMRLADAPFPPASTQMVGRQGEFRLRTGDYRIIYRVEHAPTADPRDQGSAERR